MTYQKIPKSTAGNAQTSKTTSQLTSRPFALTTKQTTPAPTPEQQQEQTEGLKIQRKTNLLEIPGLMAAPKTKLSQVIQPKLTIGEPGDKYEQEADTVARQVVQRLHAPMPNQIPDISQPKSEFVQRMKAKRWQQSRGHEQTGISVNIQRHTMPEEEVQMKPMLQKRMAAAPNLEASIEQARGRGQQLADNFRKPIVQRTSDIVIQRGLKTLESVPSRDLYAEDQAERERHDRDGGKLKEKIKKTEHKTNTEMSVVKPGLILDKSKTYIWVVKTINGKDEIIIGDEKDPITGEATQGHPTLARDENAPEGEEGSKTVAAKTAGELKWDKDLNAWILNNRSGRFGVSLRPETKDGVEQKPLFDKSVMKGVAKLFRERIGDPEFNIRYKPWRTLRADGTVEKDDGTGPSYELKPPKKILETNDPQETKIPETNNQETEIPETNNHQETEIPETNNHQETEIPETNNHQETEIPETNNHQETEIPETNNHQETEIPETNDHISKKGKIRIPISRGKEIRSSKKFPFVKIRKR